MVILFLLLVSDMRVFDSYLYICLKFLHQQRISTLDKIGVEKWNARQEVKSEEIECKKIKGKKVNITTSAIIDPSTTNSVYYKFTSIYDQFPLSQTCMEEDKVIDPHVDNTPYLVFLFKHVELKNQKRGINYVQNVKRVLELMSEHSSLFAAEEIFSNNKSLLVPLDDLMDIIAQYYFNIPISSSDDGLEDDIINMAHQVENIRLLIEYPRPTQCREELCSNDRHNDSPCDYSEDEEDDEEYMCDECESMKNCTWKFTLARSRCSCFNRKYVWDFKSPFNYTIEWDELFDLRERGDDSGRWMYREYDEMCIGYITSA